MRTIIAGSRDVTDYVALCDLLHDSGMCIRITHVISGACRGVDLLGERWAVESGMSLSRFPADWKLDGRAAGPLRNQRMVDSAEALVLLHTGGKGSGDVLKRAEKKGIEIIVRQHGHKAWLHVNTTRNGVKETILRHPPWPEDQQQP